MEIPKEIRDKRVPHIWKLVSYLNKENITCDGEDELGNVVFRCGDKVKRIRGQEFYRMSGICSYKKDLEGTLFVLLPMDDHMYYTSWLFTVLMFVFYPPKPKQ